ncbi:hypothetical protein BC829DRAFT_421353 [Chytridium lagenaria]|nr:hypothetical protein BC829DRAFT_421353 [Chytridium lagenaria]
MYPSNLKALRDRPLFKWEKYMQMRLALKGQVYTRGNIDAYIEKELSWKILDSNSAATTENVAHNHSRDAGILGEDMDFNMMDPYSDVRVQLNENLVGDIPADIVYLEKNGLVMAQRNYSSIPKVHQSWSVLNAACTRGLSHCIHKDVIPFVYKDIKYPMDADPFIGLHFDKKFKFFAIFDKDISTGPPWIILRLFINNNNKVAFDCKGVRCKGGKVDTNPCRHINILRKEDPTSEEDDKDGSVSWQPIPPPHSSLLEEYFELGKKRFKTLVPFFILKKTLNAFVG